MTHGTPERLVHPSKKELEAPGRDLKQVKYGPTADLSDEERQRVTERLAVPGLAKGAGDGLERLSQYSPDHIDYVRAAERSGRPMTEQEAQVKKRAESARPGAKLKDLRAKDASINHVIASGTGQNTLNKSIAQFTGSQSPGTQAAAVGRMQMYNRAIAHENLTPEQREAADNRGRLGNDRTVLQDADAPRNAHLKSLLTIMQGQGAPGESHYNSLLKDTFDSPGNLRVGDSRLNLAVLTGFDAEADAQGGMTARSKRLLAAHQAAHPDHDEQVFSTLNGEVMSSSRESSAGES